MSRATLHNDSPQPAVRLERRLVDQPSVVWQALTDRDQLRSWFPCDVQVAGGNWVAGATITFRFPAEIIDMTLTGQVLPVREPHLLAFRWGEETLTFELRDEVAGTLLILH